MPDANLLGVILAGGSGTRMHPVTATVNKHFLAVYDKPMLHYALSTLFIMGVRDVRIVSRPQDLPAMRGLLGDGRGLGVSISFVAQPAPAGIMDGIRRGMRGSEGRVVVVLGDNLLHGPGLQDRLRSMVGQPGAHMLVARVGDIREYGAAIFDQHGNILRLEEKPKDVASGMAIVGVYVFDSSLVGLAEGLEPSARGELEITDFNSLLLDAGVLRVGALPRGTYWQDLGTPGALVDGAQYVKVIQERTGMLVGSPEEVAWRNRWIDDEQLMALSDRWSGSAYGQALKDLLREG